MTTLEQPKSVSGFCKHLELKRAYAPAARAEAQAANSWEPESYMYLLQ